jgi:phosphoesterase RecJ-like protein
MKKLHDLNGTSIRRGRTDRLAISGDPRLRCPVRMERSALDQATDLLSRGERVLLVVPAQPSADAFCSMVGLGLALGSLGKMAMMVSASHVPAHLQFLPGTSQVRDVLERTADLVVNVPLGTVRPEHVRWEQEGETLRFVITPEKGGTFPPSAPTAVSGVYPWETIATVGSPDLSHLGPPFTEHAPFFYETPILNIDRGTANEFFGTVNLVSATAGTIAEVVYDLLDTLGGVNLLSPEVATCLYAALLTGTHSFQSPHTTPRTFAVASALLEQNADRQTVTRSLFKTHTLPELRLVGRGLARLRELSDGSLWSLLVQKDFSDSGATPETLPSVLQEIVERAGEQTPVLLVFERTAGMLETLIFPGRMSQDDRVSLEKTTKGTMTGPFVLAPLGEHAPAKAERLLAETILPHLPRSGSAG